MRQNSNCSRRGQWGKALAAPFTAMAIIVVACGHPAVDEGSSGSSNQGGGSGDGVVAATGSSGGGSSGANGSVSAGGGTGNNSGGGASGNVVGGIGSAGGVVGGTGSVGATGSSPGVPDSGPPDMVVSPDASMPAVMKMACGSQAYSDAYTPGFTPSSSLTSSTSTMVSGLTLSDKATVMRGVPGCEMNYNVFHQPGVSSVQGFAFRDGPRGVNLQEDLPMGGTGYSTAFPVASLRGATFDVALEEQVGAAIGDEMAASHGTMLLAPVINILRHPLWGRAQETYGEDSILLGRMGAAFTVGVQQYVPACAKHFAANNIEDGRETSISAMDEQTFHEIYGRHFEIVAQEGGVACIMAAYNLLQIGSNAPVKCTQSKELLTDMLRTTFGFKGFVLTDWWAMPGSNTCPLPGTAPQVAQDAVNAGLDMELPWSYNYSTLESITGAGKPLSQSQLTTSATRIVEQQLRFNVAKPGTWGLKTPTTGQDPNSKSITNSQSHVALAYKSALEGMVLLKNDKNVLPIPKTVKSVAVIGEDVSYSVSTQMGTQNINFATTVRLGDMGSSRVFSDPKLSTAPFDGIKAAAGSGITVTTGSTAAAVSTADFVVIVAGLTPQDEGEEYTKAGDRYSLSLDGRSVHDNGGTSAQNTLIAQVAAAASARNVPVVVVLEGGAVIDTPWISSVNAVVMAWYPGLDGGHALGDLLFGNANFSGKLPVTWMTQAQMTAMPPFNGGTTTQMDYYLGYRYFDKNNIVPQFPFGFGLSYTSFSYSNLQVPCSTVAKDGVVEVQADVTNTGTVDGDEVSFLFVSFPATTKRRSVKELKAFHRSTIKAGQTQRITIPLRVSDLKYWDTTSGSWQVESGPVQIMVGPSSATLPLKDMVTVN